MTSSTWIWRNRFLLRLFYGLPSFLICSSKITSLYQMITVLNFNRSFTFDFIAFSSFYMRLFLPILLHFWGLIQFGLFPSSVFWLSGLVHSLFCQYYCILFKALSCQLLALLPVILMQYGARFKALDALTFDFSATTAQGSLFRSNPTDGSDLIVSPRFRPISSVLWLQMWGRWFQQGGWIEGPELWSRFSRLLG